MTKRYWFKAKNYGWGWRPATWEGWLVIILYVLVEVLLFLKFYELSQTPWETFSPFLSASLIFTLLLIIVCYKTGEKPSWRWGRQKGDHHD